MAQGEPVASLVVVDVPHGPIVPGPADTGPRLRDVGGGYDGGDRPRPARWAVVTGVAVVAVVLACLIAFVAFVAVMRSRTLPAQEAKVGQCVDLRTFLADGVKLVEARCDEPHDAEVVWVGRLDGSLRHAWRKSSEEEFCAARPIDATYTALIDRGGYSVGAAGDGDEEDRWSACYLEPASGRLKKPLR